MASTWLRSIQAAAKRIAAWAKLVAMKAKRIASDRDGLFEFAFLSDIEQTWLLARGQYPCWFRVSFIDGGGRPVKYEDGVFEKFDQSVSDATQNDDDPTILFIATDGRRVFKAFSGPDSAMVDEDPQFSTGFDDGVFIGIWSHSWLRRRVAELEETEDPDSGWGRAMEDMVMAISDYADSTEK
jgi:hypothetical protein